MYQYRGAYSYSNLGYSSATEDSGTVEYTILDSLKSEDTTVTWTILQARRLTHRLQDPGTDTAYSISDSSKLTLIEATTGNHELRAASLIWNFPVLNQSHDTLRVNRYSDSSQAILHNGYYCLFTAEPAFDSLSLRADSGLCRRTWFTCIDFGDFFGSSDFGDCRLLSRTVVSVEGREPVPKLTSLISSYPNPFNQQTTIEFDLAQYSDTQLSIYDLIGRQVSLLESGRHGPGHYQYHFDASMLGSGVYLIRISIGGIAHTLKAVLLK